jgi:hypothetical protein
MKIGIADHGNTRGSNTWFELVASTTMLAVLLTFWFLGGFDSLDQLVRDFTSRAFCPDCFISAFFASREKFSFFPSRSITPL